MVKRSFDIVVSGFGLIILSPLMAITAIIIKLDSHGPIFYRGTRTGRHGIPFAMLKFRSMVSNAEQVGGTSTAATDPRITRVGRFLRQTKLDELPQLVNVFKGEMSLVGPRPEVEEYTRLYSQEERAILSVRPGITDLSSIRFLQLNALLARVDDPDRYFAEKILPDKNRLRVEYIRRKSFLLDLEILFQTLRCLWIK
jgi:lipopolysaccharide/colanic/teichoic acid biosynthesis glycosyltransferase